MRGQRRSEMEYPKISKLTEENLKLNILRFSWFYGFNISPEKNLDKYVVRLKGVGHCACHDERLSCPCPEAESEVKSQGYCSCQLFVDNSYLRVIQERIQRKVRANPDYRPDK